MTDYVMVKRSDLLRWAEDFVRDNDPGDDTDVVTPFDDYLLRPPAEAQPVGELIEDGAETEEGTHFLHQFVGPHRLPEGTKIYAHPPPSAPVGVEELVRDLVREIEHNTCTHEDTRRGGSIWEICDACGAEWADDRGGKPDFKWPDCVERAHSWLAQRPAAVDVDVAWIRLCGSQGEPAGAMTVTAELRDGSEVVLIRDTGNEIDHAVNLAAALAAKQGGHSDD